MANGDSEPPNQKRNLHIMPNLYYSIMFKLTSSCQKASADTGRC